MDLVVRFENGCWRASCGPASYACAIGRAGVVAAEDKREGDGATPLGAWPVREIRHRPDRVASVECVLPTAPISPDDGWCDDPGESAYNRPVKLPFAGSHERMWRDDGLYDLVCVLGHNDDPPRPGMGSAIFLHCAGEGLPPTAGCVALARGDLQRVLSQFREGDRVVVEPPATAAN
jgi:L,D-peptidoglycan transpeptidase YkuD (ErfK/YbiS/YcfS/YnhG family)